MKNVFSLFAILALVGAGCTGSTPAELPIDTTGLQVTTSDGLVTTQQNDKIDATADGIPVTEVVLGAPVNTEVDMSVGNYFFKPTTITAKAGDRVKINFKDVVGTHTFVIDSIGAKYNIKPNEGYTFRAPTEPGSYPFYCDIGSHRQFGMEGTLIVE